MVRGRARRILYRLSTWAVLGMSCVGAADAAACTLKSPPPISSPAEVRERAVSNFRSGLPLAVVIATYRGDFLTLRILRSFSPGLRPGIYSRQRLVIPPCGGLLQPNEKRLAWVDQGAEWPQVVSRSEAEALLDAGLLRDESVLALTP